MLQGEFQINFVNYYFFELESAFFRSEEDTKNLWWLLITVYGLCDAQRACYLKVKEVLEKESVVNMAIQYFTCTGKIN